jgi:hypothetical protein
MAAYCFVKVDYRSFDSWYSLIESMKHNTAVLAKLRDKKVYTKDFMLTFTIETNIPFFFYCYSLKGSALVGSEAAFLTSRSHAISFFETPPEVQRRVQLLKTI